MVEEKEQLPLLCRRPAAISSNVGLLVRRPRSDHTGGSPQEGMVDIRCVVLAN